MKTIRLILGTALILCTSTVRAPAHGCGFGFYVGIPFLVGIGFGIGAGCAYPAYGCAYHYPAYPYYPHPAYAYNPPANYAPPLAATPEPSPAAPVVTQSPVWVPSTPGAGHWVPDPQPYQYAPPVAAKPPPSATSDPAQTVTVTKSPEGIPLYIITAQN